jgi:hypothetical protein
MIAHFYSHYNIFFKLYHLINIACITRNLIYFHFTFMIKVNAQVHDNDTLVKIIFSLLFIHFFNLCELVD